MALSIAVGFSFFFFIGTFLNNRNIIYAFYNANGSLFAINASLYYLFDYPFPIGAGIVAGIGKLQLIKIHTK